MKLRAADVCEDLRAAMAVECIGCGPETLFDGVCTDSRAEVRGCLFVALRGERFDAHVFVPEVLQRGAAGVVVETAALASLATSSVARYGVADTLAGLQAVARGSLRRVRPRVVSITGSNGKTTTKDLTVAALSAAGRAFGTRGNLNNHIGVPLTILMRRGDEDFLVAEAGASDFGELELISRLLEPDIVVITNIGRAHLERFGSQQGVLRAKSELLIGLCPGGVAVLPADDPFLPGLVAAAGQARIVTFGQSKDATYRIESSRDLGTGQELVMRGETFVLGRAGTGNAANAAAAFAVACEAGAAPRAIGRALAACTFTGGRSDWVQLGPFAVLDDTYNANPDSMAQGLALLASRPARRVAVLGDMLELGSESATYHAELGRRVAASKVAYFFGLGREMAAAVEAARSAGLGDRARHFDAIEALVAALHAVLEPGDAVLVKGSRGARMERVVAALAAEVA